MPDHALPFHLAGAGRAVTPARPPRLLHGSGHQDGPAAPERGAAETAQAPPRQAAFPGVEQRWAQ